MEHLSLLAGGQEPTLAEWEHAAAALARRSDRMAEQDPDATVREVLAHRDLDGLTVPALSTRASLDDVRLPDEAERSYSPRGMRSGSEPAWDNRPGLDDPDASRSARALRTDLAGGATSAWLTLGSGGIAAADLGTVLGEVALDVVPIVLEAPAEPLAAAGALADVLRERGTVPARATNLGVDPLGARVRRVPAAETAEVSEIVARAAEQAQSLGTLGIVVDATAVHDRGASAAQELGYALAAGAAYLRILSEAGHDPAAACGLLEFRFAATDEQLSTIAKLRAARRLWHRMLELSDVPPHGRDQLQHAVTSRPMMSRYDPWVNMVRTTVAAFAAGVAGADAVSVLPFDDALGLPDDFGRRVARNTSSLLVWESHLGRVTDPAGGSYAVEQHTHDLAHAAWAELARIERSGGVLAALQDGSLAARTETVAAERADQVARRTRPLTGVSEFPNLHEELPERRQRLRGPGSPGTAMRYGTGFERMRDEPASPPVFLATLGTVAAHTARAGFVTNLLAAGGVGVRPSGASEDSDAVLAAYDAEPVVCLAGTDDAYAQWGEDVVSALRDAGARWVVLAGRPASGLGVDDTCVAGDDALAFLTRIRERLEAQ